MKFLLLEFSSEKKSSAIFANQELIIYIASLLSLRVLANLRGFFHVCSYVLEMELCTGFEPVIPVLQTSALTNLANRALKLELTLRLELRTYALQVRRSTN